MAGFSKCCRSWCTRFASCCPWPYETPRTIRIRNGPLIVTFWVLILGVLSYIIGYVIVKEKGYQDNGDILSSVSTRVQGAAYPNRSDIAPALNRVWDIAGLIVPPQQRDGFFVMTNMIITPDQSQGTCAEAPWAAGNVSCTDADTSNCPAGKVELTGNGMFTGKCADFNSGAKTCEIRGWCPVEKQENPPNPAILEGAKEFVVLLKNTISFPSFGVTRRNILHYHDAVYLQNCRFNNSHPVDRYCPNFRLGTIVKEANQNFTELATQGGIIGIFINWNCNLDKAVSECRPVYSFTRLDKADSQVLPGYNFRYARYYKQNDKDYRTLINTYGIRFDVIVSGKAGKFNIIPTTMNIGSGLGLLGLAAFLCDQIIRCFCDEKRREVDKDADLYLSFRDCTCCGQTEKSYEQLDERPSELPTQSEDDSSMRAHEGSYILKPVSNYGQEETV